MVDVERFLTSAEQDERMLTGLDDDGIEMEYLARVLHELEELRCAELRIKIEAGLILLGLNLFVIIGLCLSVVVFLKAFASSLRDRLVCAVDDWVSRLRN